MEGENYRLYIIPFATNVSGGYDDVKFTWKASTGASGYLVYYKKGTGSYSKAITVTGYQISKSTSKTGTSIVATYKTTSGTNKTVTATKGKKYYYKVRAYKVVNGTKVFAPWSAVKAYTRK